MGKTVEAAVSGALLRGILYLGAFMIVVASAILVILFWDIFPQALQLLFMASVPTVFYLAGWGARVKLKLPEVGSVLGQPHLSSQDLAEIIHIPSSFEPLGLDATLACAFLF